MRQTTVPRICPFGIAVRIDGLPEGYHNPDNRRYITRQKSLDFRIILALTVHLRNGYGVNVSV